MFANQPPGRFYDPTTATRRASAWIFCNVREREEQRASAMLVSNNCGSLSGEIVSKNAIEHPYARRMKIKNKNPGCASTLAKGTTRKS
jgi:hypothetical protein